MKHAAAFRKALLNWYDRGHRDLPWRETTDFYRVWLSEIMLQQTRVEAVTSYYRRFLELFPRVEDLARASEPAVLTAWSGLGYYSRARNLHRAAKQIAGNGFPTTHDGVRALPGAGPYTAAAIASISLGLPHAAVDGNVLRVISRVTNDSGEISASATKQRIAGVADRLVDCHRPGDFNQAMMELGATVCTPRNPACAACPVAKLCEARAAGTERELPVKLKKQQTREVSLDLAVVTRDGEILLVQRSKEESRMAGFWELPQKSAVKGAKPHAFGDTSVATFRHQIVNDRFTINVWRTARGSTRGGHWVRFSELDTLPLSTVTKKTLARTRLLTEIHDREVVPHRDKDSRIGVKRSR